jgi:hypothetical protein
MLRPLRNFWRNLRRRWQRPAPPPKPQPPGPPRVEFSYTIFWTKQVRAWDAARRSAVLAALHPVLAQPGFEGNDYERRYTVPGLDEHAHAGASLLALDKVLHAFVESPD